MSRKYTLKQIAKELNVSRATLDRVIYNRGGIGKETEERIRAFLEKVDYKPNRAAKGLAARLEKKIAIILPSQNKFLRDVKRGIEIAQAEIKDFGFQVQVLEAHGDSAEQIELIHQSVKQGAHGLAVAPYEPEQFVDVVDHYIDEGLPVITVNSDIKGSSRLYYIGTDYYRSGRIAGEVLAKAINQGTVAVLANNSTYWHNAQRIAGFRDVIRTFHQVEWMDVNVQFNDYHSAYEAMKGLCETEAPPRGVFVIENTDGVVEGVGAALKEYPALSMDIVTLDLDEERIKALQEGYVTASICQDPFSQGYYAVKILFKYLFDGEAPQRKLYTTRLDVIYKENLDNYEINYYNLI